MTLLKWTSSNRTTHRTLVSAQAIAVVNPRATPDLDAVDMQLVAVFEDAARVDKPLLGGRRAVGFFHGRFQVLHRAGVCAMLAMGSEPGGRSAKRQAVVEARRQQRTVDFDVKLGVGERFNAHLDRRHGGTAV